MFKHNLILIYRNFRRFKSTFFINLVGLSTGMACTLLIYLWVMDEWKMDKFHEKDSTLYRVMVNNPISERIETSPSTQAILGEALVEEVPEIETEVTTVGDNIDFTLSVGQEHVTQKGILAGEDFFQVFSFKLIAGNRDLVLKDKKTIVLSEATAIALFGNTSNAVGNTIEWQFPHGKGEALVSGVFENVLDNSSIRFDFLLPFEIYKDLVGKESLHWGNFGCNTYVTLKPGTNASVVTKKISGFITKKAKDLKMTLFLIPFSSYYLYGNYTDGKQDGGRIEYVKLFSLIGVFILIIACINFMNLSTAKASRKIKEVGVKKAIGASRKNLIYQYLGESLFLTFLSMLIALLIVDLLIPKFNEITGKNLDLVFSSQVLSSLFAITTFTGLVSGSYPALYLSGFAPAEVLKGKFQTQSKSVIEIFARKGLIVFQFTLSILFIVGVAIIYKQIDFVQTKHLGYEKDNLIYVRPEGRVAKDTEAFITELKKQPGVVNASSIARTIVGSRASTVGYFSWEGKDPNAIIPFEIVNGDYDLIETLGIKMKEGRPFAREFTSDTASIILNEAAIDVMGMKEPIGKIFNLWGKDLKIIGVTENFHFESLHQKVKPLFFRLAPEDAEQILVRINPGEEQTMLTVIDKFYKQFNPGYAFEYTFLNKDYDAQYNSEKRVGLLSRYFAVLAVLISCLGLFGLAAFTAERRTKEIGIRKVLGSGEWRIIYLLSADFTLMVIIASAIALPISYFLSERWLSVFAYRIPLMWWYFPAAGILALFIAWLTVGLQAFKAARVNPSQCLKEE